MQIKSRIAKQRIPWLMAGVRAALGPAMILGERAGWSGLTLVAMVIAALLSDIFDGVLARRWKCDTAAVRLFDSMADIIFYVGCALALWMRRPGVAGRFAVPIAAVVGLELLGLGFALIKFGKLPSYHSYLAKTWGLVLAGALIVAFVTPHITGWIMAALSLGVLCGIEGLAMSWIMPVWRQDVKTLAVAWRLRGISRRRKSRLMPKMAGAAILLFALAGLPAHAQKSGEAAYETGTAGTAANMTAPMTGHTRQGDHIVRAAADARSAIQGESPLHAAL